MFSRNRYKNSDFFHSVKDGIGNGLIVNQGVNGKLNEVMWSAQPESNNISLHSCWNTNLIQQYPLPEVKEYYEDDQFYTQHVKAKEWFEKEKKEYEARLWNSYFEYLASRMNPNLPLLDVGCGAGWFASYYRHYIDAKVELIEPSRLAKEYASSDVKPFYNKSLDHMDITGMQQYSDWNILMSLVLEHIPDPISFIQQYIPFMGEEGTLTIVVPNEFNPLQQWLGSTHFIQDVHINYFTPDSLINIIFEATDMESWKDGFEYYISATFPMEIFELLGFHYIENGNLGRKCHNFRLHLEKLFGKRIFKLYEILFDKYGIGRELIFTVRRL